MRHNLSYRQKINIRYIFLLLFLLLITLNIILNIVNSNFRDRKIIEENNEIVELTKYLIEDNNLSVAIEFLEHYKDSHHIDFSMSDAQGNLIYSSSTKAITEYTDTIIADGVEYTFGIDNTHSITVDLLNKNILYSNITIITLSIVLLIVLIFSNSISYKRIARDIEYIMHYIKSEEFLNEGFNYHEFEKIYNSLLEYTKKVDILNEQKKLSVTGLAHDIKTPLTIIKSYVNPYKDATNPITREKCIKAIERISKLVDHLRQDDYAGAFYVFDISKLIKQEMQAYYSIFTHKNIEIELSLQEHAYVKWNMKQASIVLDNLFSNAYYYSTEDSTYRISLRIVKDEIVITFTSFGNPISTLETEAIFEKGYRSNMTKRHNIDGDGMGLYITKILLMQANAKISVKVQNLENKFKIKIPLSEKEQG